MENENNVVNNEQVNNGVEAGNEIVIQEGGKLKKILKWVGSGLALVATGVAGFLIGRGAGKDDADDNGDPVEEGPTED